MAVVALLLLFGAFFGLAAFHSVLVQNQLRIDRLAKEVAVEEALHDQLRLAYARQSSPDRMLAEAQAREMVQPTEREYLSVVIPGDAAVPPPSPNPYNTRRVPSTTAVPATSAPPTTVGAAPTTVAGAPTTARPTASTATTRAVTPTTARPTASTATTRAVTPTTARPTASTAVTPTTGAAR
jgi:hypothetical protein